MNKIAAFDIDNTLTKSFLITPMMQSEQAHGLLPPGTYEQSVELLTAVRRGEIEYEVAAHSLLVMHAQALRGQRIVDLARHAQDYVHGNTELFRRFGSQVIQLLKPTHELMAVTAEPEYMARAVAGALGIDKVLASTYNVDDAVFTGEVGRSLAHRSEKQRLVGSLRPEFAFGDSAGDIDMLRHARYAYCIAPDDALEQEAQKDGWDIYAGDEDADQLVASVAARLRTPYDE
jgi:phosphoserine phosphatase